MKSSEALTALTTLIEQPAFNHQLSDRERRGVVRGMLELAGVEPDPTVNDSAAPADECEIREADDTPRQNGGYIGLARGLDADRRARSVSSSISGYAGSAATLITPELIAKLHAGIQRFQRAKDALEFFDKHAFRGPWIVAAKVLPSDVSDEWRGKSDDRGRTIDLRSMLGDGELTAHINRAFQPFVGQARAHAAKLLQEEYETAELELRTLWKSLDA